MNRLMFEIAYKGREKNVLHLYYTSYLHYELFLEEDDGLREGKWGGDFPLSLVGPTGPL